METHVITTETDWSQEEVVEDVTEDWVAADHARQVLSGQLRTLVAEGIFTDAEATAWVAGAENCGGRADWVEGLLESLREYVESGEAVWEEIEALLRSEVFSINEKTTWLNYASKSRYHEKLALIGRLTMVVKQREAAKLTMERTKFGKVEDLVTAISNAIGAGKVEDAVALLAKLDPAEYRVSYIKLSRDLDNLRIKTTQEWLDQLEVSAMAA